MEMIERSERIGWILLAVSLAIAGASVSFVRRVKTETWSQVWMGALLVSHPGWWMSARGGDCGTTRLYTSFGATGAMVMLAIVVVLRSLRRR
jgi:hypothetical protein